MQDKDDESTTESRRPHEYFCMFRPFFDVQNENAAKPEEDQLNEDHLLYRYNEAVKADDSIELKPASEHPEHRWVAMWETWKLFSAWERRASYTNPEFFNMHISKHFHGYGMQEMVENMVRGFASLENS